MGLRVATLVLIWHRDPVRNDALEPQRGWIGSGAFLTSSQILTLDTALLHAICAGSRSPFPDCYAYMDRAPSKRWQQIETLFVAALDLPAEARSAFLDTACDVPLLRTEVARLLDAHDEAEGFLEYLDGGQAAALIEAVEKPFKEGSRVGPYRLLRELGRGGMGRVYLAEDTRLDRRVALKFLPPHLAADERAKKRLIEEAKAASALDHPNIAVVHEISESADGQLFIAMAYYDGETLRERIEHGLHSVEEVLALAPQVAEGLQAAHAKGVVHRDVKPGNVIVIEPDVAKIVDFGIAKAQGTGLTTEGGTPGTVAYMSPEQTRGEAVDVRTDLWSLGVVLYEMLSGVRPFTGEHEQTLIYAIRHDAPESVRSLRPEVPAALADIVERCLEKEPARRYPNAAALLADLDALRDGAVSDPRTVRRMRYGLSLALVLLAAVLAGLLYVQQEKNNPGPEVAVEVPLPYGNRMAVLPLANLSADPEDAYFADGLTEELISRLSKLRDLRVIARTSVLPYRETDKSITEIGGELDVGTLLEGSVRKVGEQVRVTVQLIDAESQEHLWAEDYDAGMEDILAVQGEIAEQIAEALQVQMQESERQALSRQATAAEAYTLYLKGRYFWNKRDAASFEQARVYFQLALDEDPMYAQAWAGLADTYQMLASIDAVAPEKAMSLARAAAERALALDDHLAEAHTALAVVLMSFYREWEAAGRHLRRAVTDNPNYALAHQQYAQYLAIEGRFDEAVAEARRAQALDPLSLYARANAGWILYLAGRQEEAAVHLRETIALNPDFGLAHLDLGLVYLEVGSFEEAVKAFETLRALWGDSPAVMGLLGHAYARQGRPATARRLLDALRQRQLRTPFHEAVLYIGLGEHKQALNALEEAVNQRSGLVMYLGVDPIIDPLRSDLRFQSLLETVGRAG